MEKLRLLPHSWQYVGWWLVGGGLVLLLYSLFAETDSAVFFASTPWTFGCALKTVGFLVVPFSREKFEDERINVIRFNTLGLIAVVYAVMLVAYPVLDVLLIYFSAVTPMEIGGLSAVRGVLGVLPL